MNKTVLYEGKKKATLRKLYEEADTLSASIDRLIHTVSHLPNHRENSETQGKLMSEQVAHMTEYEDVLHRRIADLEGELGVLEAV